MKKEEVSLAKEQEAALTMALRELTNNLVKHSQAKTCRILIRENKDHVEVLVEDDGIGFANLTGQELHSVRDRFLRYKGEVQILSAQNPTCIQLEIPKEVGNETISC